jgi:fructokinase
MRIGIDLGGTKIEAVALDVQGHELRRLRVPTPTGDYTGTISALVNIVDQIEQDLADKASVGIGMPGTISPATGKVKNANSVWLNDRDFQEDLGSALGRPVRLANDANCFALSEATDGAAAGADVVFGVIIGTGTGGGVVVHGRIVRGVNAIAGEWGHNPLPWPNASEIPGPQCWCGLKACLETYLSGPGFSRDFRENHERELAAPVIVDLANKGDPEALAALDRYEDRLARGLASVINILDPDAIVLGGGMSNIARLYKNVPQLWVQYVFSDRVDTKLLPAKYGDTSGVRGAAWLWDRE